MISIIIPVYNSENTISKVVNELSENLKKNTNMKLF